MTTFFDISIYEEFERCLTDLIDYVSLEIPQRGKGEDNADNYYLSYMMNDAVEYYFILKNCHLTGEPLADDEEPVTARFIRPSGDTSAALIIHQGQNNVYTIWFEELERILSCYAYHQIGHFWRSGQEQWRQLVYIIGTVYDKYLFIGDHVCNEEELELLPVMEFAPFRHWFPIHEEPWERYPDTEQAIHTMAALAEEAGDHAYARLVQNYGKLMSVPAIFTLEQKLRQPLTRYLARQLTKRKRIPFYHLIWNRVLSASSQYAPRDYGEVRNQEITALRQEVDILLKNNGFTGSYPLYFKGQYQITAAEEHPFTVEELEYDNFPFHIQFMVSNCGKTTAVSPLSPSDFTPENSLFTGRTLLPVDESDEHSQHLPDISIFQTVNAGFFHGTGNQGSILKNIDELRNWLAKSL